MAWQEDLRKLDEELAAGRITAEEYRLRRDTLLSAAAAGQAPAPGATESTQMMSPIAGNPPQDSADRTQVVSNSPSSSEKTQVVSSQDVGDASRTQAVRPAWQGQSPNWGQRVPGVPPQQGNPANPPSPQQGFPSQPLPAPWESRSSDTGSPWGEAEFPPLTQYASNADWLKQGPEVFGKSSSGGKKWLVAVAIVVVVLGLGTGGYFLFFNKGGSTGTGPNTSQVAGPTTAHKPAQPKDDLQVAKLPGTGPATPTSGQFSMVVSDGLLTTGEAQAYQTAGATEARLNDSTLSNGTHVLVVTVRTSSSDAATTAVTNLSALQLTYGFGPYSGNIPTGVQIAQVTAATNHPATIRAHYRHKDTVVRIQVYGPDLGQLGSTFHRVLTAQLALLPADGS